MTEIKKAIVEIVQDNLGINAETLYNKLANTRNFSDGKKFAATVQRELSWLVEYDFLFTVLRHGERVYHAN